MSASERKFLHDLASPLTIAQGMTDAASEIVRDRKPIDEKLLNKLEKSTKALERMTEMLRLRRSEIAASDGGIPPTTD